MTDDAVLGPVLARLAAEGEGLTAAGVARALRADGRLVGDADVLAVHDQLRREVEGAGALSPLLAIPGVTDVLVNGPDQVWIDRGSGLELTDVRFDDDEAVRRLAQRMAAAGNRRLDDAVPFVDVRLGDGTRFHAVLAPVARPGTTISLRVPAARGLSLDDLARSGSMGPQVRRLLERVITSRAAFLISGGTGSGKTTLLGALLGLVPCSERIVVVEDSTELQPEHPHVVSLEGRPPNLEGAGEVRMQVLVRQALRMRPDRIVVGEVRGAEVVDLLAAMNTGHEGGCGTIHANSAADVPARVESLATAAGLSREAAQSQFSSAVDLVIHLQRTRRGSRRVRELGVVERRGQDIVVSPAVVVGEDELVVEGPGIGALVSVLER